MKKIFLIAFFGSLISCSDTSDRYESLPVSVDLSTVPYPTLSEYHFFAGNLKSLTPAESLVPFKPTSELFSDYASKQRYLWLPAGTTGNYTGDDEVIALPVGAVLIKNFFYDNVQPSGGRRIIETRLMIRKANGWIFADYIWNDGQTEAFLNLGGGTTHVSWSDNGGVHEVDYVIPSENNCATCHANSGDNYPIGIKPRNLNSVYPYANGAMNQLVKLQQQGYVQNLPSDVTSVVDYSNTANDLDLRVRSYLDINCAHCHIDGGNASYTSPRFSFEMTTDPANLGICVGAQFEPPGIPHGLIVKPGNPLQSVLHYCMSTNQPNYKMPRLGRTVVHSEALALLEQWIISLPECE